MSRYFITNLIELVNYPGEYCHRERLPRDAGNNPQALKAQVEHLPQNPSPDTFARVVALVNLEPGRPPTGFARINTVLDAL